MNTLSPNGDDSNTQHMASLDDLCAGAGEIEEGRPYHAL
jgi:hypothetical protein